MRGKTLLYIEQVRSEKNGSFVCVQVMHVGGRPRTHVTVHLVTGTLETIPCA